MHAILDHKAYRLHTQQDQPFKERLREASTGGRKGRKKKMEKERESKRKRERKEMENKGKERERGMWMERGERHSIHTLHYVNTWSSYLVSTATNFYTKHSHLHVCTCTYLESSLDVNHVMS